MSTTNDGAQVTPAAVWLAMIALVNDDKSRTRERIDARIDMPFSRFRALRRLERGPRTQRELGEAMGVDAPAVSGIVADLVARGLAERTPHPDDGRCKVVTITDAGRAILDDLRDSPDFAPRAFGELSPAELAGLAGLLERLRSGAES